MMSEKAPYLRDRNADLRGSHTHDDERQHFVTKPGVLLFTERSYIPNCGKRVMKAKPNIRWHEGLE